MILLEKDLDSFSIVDFVSKSNEFELVTKSTDDYVNYATEMVIILDSL